MVKINIVVNDKLDLKFRQAVSDKLGWKKGNYSKAFEEAMQDWIKK